MRTLAALAAKYADVLSLRPVPKLKRHPVGSACVAYKVRGRRVWVYFGQWGSRAAEVKYTAWARCWPSQLYELATAGKSPGPRWLTYGGRTQRLSAWAKETGLRSGTIAGRLAAGWTVERALTTPKGGGPVRSRGARGRFLRRAA